MLKRLAVGLFCLAAVMAATSAAAEVRMPRVFTDHMVLQRDKPIAVWGWADAGEEVTVTLGDDTATARTDETGRWRVDLPPREADAGGLTLTVAAGNTVAFEQVLIGEVWIASGQSNMARGVNLGEVADDPLLRLFCVRGSETPREHDLGECVGWLPCNEDNARAAGPFDGRQFSEVAYHFAASLREDLGVPVGVIETCYGGSQAQAWTRVEDIEAEYPFDVKAEGGYLGHRPGLLYQSMLHGLVPYTARGVIWYQGENDGRSNQYEEDFSALIADWRGHWDAPDWPFYFVQIAPTSYAGGRMQFIWEAQQRVMENVPHTGMAVTNDMMSDTHGDGTTKITIDERTGFPVLGGSNPHPDGKTLAAQRLAAIALVQAYDREARPLFGPMYESHTIEDGRVLITMKHVGGGLTARDGEALNWFELTDGTREGRDYVFVPARAEVVAPDTIAVWAEGLDEPAHVRFAWHCLARHNLMNDAGLPGVSFRTYED